MYSLLIRFLFRFILLPGLCGLASCSLLEKASLHGLGNGRYSMKVGKRSCETVYADVAEEQISLHRLQNSRPDSLPFLRLPLVPGQRADSGWVVLRRQSLDIDISSVLFKYRPSVYGLPPQLSNEFNLALYAGWRFDYFRYRSRRDALGRYRPSLSGRGFDMGIFAGPGTTLISPFTTRGQRSDEYNGMIMQTGIAAFFELSMASFGFAAGADFLAGPDRKNWIYQNRLWLGFVVGIALN
jgi:hypothetical protein